MMKTGDGNVLAKSLQTFCNTSLQSTAPIKFNTVIIFMHLQLGTNNAAT